MTEKKASDALVPVADDTLDVARYDNQREKLLAFVGDNLKKDKHYGRIPGCGDKPALFKEGAEQLLMLFRLGHRFTCTRKAEDDEKGFYSYTYDCTIFPLGSEDTIIANMEGCANNREKKWASRPAADMQNTVMKMAQKRAKVGATIEATNSSEFFSQDIESMSPEALGQTASVAPVGGERGREWKAEKDINWDAVKWDKAKPPVVVEDTDELACPKCGEMIMAHWLTQKGNWLSLCACGYGHAHPTDIRDEVNEGKEA